MLPGDKMYQAMEIEPEFMRPAILHGFGTSAKKRLPVRPAELAQCGWMPLAAALFGTVGRGMGSPIPSSEEGAWTREGPKVVE